MWSYLLLLLIGIGHLLQSHYAVFAVPPLQSALATGDASESDLDIPLRPGRWVFPEIKVYKVGGIVSSSDERWLLTVGNIVSLWDTTLGIERFQFVVKNPEVATISPDGRFVTIGSGNEDGHAPIYLYELTRGELVRIYSGHTRPITTIAFSPDGEWLLSGSRDGTVRLWRTSSASEVNRFTGSAGSFLAEGTRILSVDGNRVRIWDIASGGEQVNFKIFGGQLASVLPNGTLLVTGAWDGNTEIYTFGDDGMTHVRFKGQVYAASSSHDGRWLVTGDDDGAVRLWDTASWEEKDRFYVDKGNRIWGIAYLASKNMILTSASDGTVHLWHSGREWGQFISFPDGNWAVVHPYGQFDGSNDGDIPDLQWQVGSKHIPVSERKAVFYKSGLLAKLLSLELPLIELPPSRTLTLGQP